MKKDEIVPKIKALQDEIEFLKRHHESVYQAGYKEGRRRLAADLRELLGAASEDCS